jgi:environmental stress-induced protein Ves
MRLIRAADCRRMPWKNGGGETAEVAISPSGAPLDAFDWRVSMARVDGDGPFSTFPGVDRTLAILAGAGLMLRVADREPVRLDDASLPYTFPADVATSADLLHGPITDLNVMTRRTRCRHRVRRRAAAGREQLPLSAATTLVVCARGRARLTVDGAEQVLGPHDAAHIDGPSGAIHVAGDQRADLLIVEIDPL